VPESKTVRAANRRRDKPAGVMQKVAAGADWQTVTFATDSIKHSDGFELEFAGATGTRVELKSVRFERVMHAGLWRTEFALPAGKVWRAIGEVGMMSSLAVNGEVVPSRGGMRLRPSFNHSNGEMFDCEALDLAPLLKAGGKNAIALHSVRNNAPPYVYFTLTVVMESGEVVRVRSDGSWKHGVMRPLADLAKASTPGFSADGWVAANGKPGSSLNYKAATARPAYAGLLVIENPREPYLFYRDDAPVEFALKTPPGMAGTTVEWNISRFDAGKLVAGAKGTAAEGRIVAGKLARGVYSLELTLKRGDTVLERRIPEPFVVTGRVPMREVAGDSLTEGMDLVLEAEIDFTKPDARFPVQEAGGERTEGVVATPTLTEKNGLRYRETGTARGALIAHQYRFAHPGEFYLMELEFPDDAERWFGVSVTSSMAAHTSKDGPAVFTGQKYPLSGKMKTMHWIHRPDPGPSVITLSNLQRESSAAASKLRIRHIKDGLPALAMPRDSGARLLGQYTERTSPTGGFGKTFGFNATPRAQVKNGQTTRDNDPVLAMCGELAYHLDAAEHYAQWLRFTGQNLHVMGCLQYFESNTAFTAPGAYPDSRCLPDLHDVAIRVLGANDVKVIASLEYVCHQSFIREYPANDGEVALGADTIYLVNREGKQPFNWLGRYGMNFLHPRVAGNMTAIARDLNRKFAGQPNYLGVNFTTYAGGDMLPSYLTQGWKDPLDSSFDDITCTKFAKDTGVKLPGTAKDPQRFAQRADFLLAPAMKEKWLQWRCEQIRDFFANMRRELGNENSFISLYVDVLHAQQMSASGMTPRDYLRQFGWSPEVYQNQPGLWFPKWTHATQRYASMTKIKTNELWPAAWDMSVGTDYNATFDQPENRAVVIMHHWQEHEEFSHALPEREDWPRPFQMTYQAQAAGDHARELFTQSLLTTDPEMVIWGFSDLVMQTGHEQPLREFARVLRSLPKAKLQPALGTTLESDLVIREVVSGSTRHFVAANPCPWPVKGRIEASGGSTPAFSLDLKPYEVRAFQAPASVKLTRVQTEPPAEIDLAHLHQILADAEKLLTNRTLAARVLREPTDRTFVEQILTAAKAALSVKQPAKAWSLVTQPRFWILTRTKFELTYRPQRNK